MAALITIVCPDCRKEVRAPADFAGKKVRCKQCGNVFRADPSAPQGTIARSPSAPPPAKASPPPVASFARFDEDEDGPDQYSLQVDGAGTNRCPECANELEGPDAIICLHCGYNTVTRERLALRKVEDITERDRLLWLLPGFVCALAVLFIAVIDILYAALLRPHKDASGLVKFLSWGGVKMWVIIGSFFVMVLAGRFAYHRLIVNAHPPERERG
jgi:hypothetical protein